jgi:hypothetical protein
MRAKFLQNINLVDKNYALENDLAVIKGQMVSILAQNQLLQEQLSTTQTQTNCALPVPPNEGRMDDDAPVPIHGAWLGIPIFGSNFCDPHWKQNLIPFLIPEILVRFFFEIPMSGNSEIWNSNLRNSEFW